MNDIGWGILGTGGIAHTFARALLDDGHRVAAVGSRDRTRAEAFASEFGIPAAHAGAEALAADRGVDVVYVATPHSEHAANAEAALAEGKHVVVEKSFALNAAQASRIVDAASGRGLLVMEAMWTRFLPHVARIREILASGVLGEVREFAADHLQSLPTDPHHRLNDPAIGGGALLDLGVYPVSFASMLFGEPDTVHAAARFGPTGVDAATDAVLGYGGRALASVRCALDARGGNTATILGTEARIEIDDLWYAPTSFRVIDSGGRVLETYQTLVSGHGMTFEAREAERLVRAGETESPLMPLAESVSIMRTLDAIRAQIGLVYPQESDGER